MAQDKVILCGNSCGHDHDSPNGPSGCCAEHGPYMYYCYECSERRAATIQDIKE